MYAKTDKMKINLFYYNEVILPTTCEMKGWVTRNTHSHIHYIYGIIFVILVLY